MLPFIFVLCPIGPKPDSGAEPSGEEIRARTSSFQVSFSTLVQSLRYIPTLSYALSREKAEISDGGGETFHPKQNVERLNNPGKFKDLLPGEISNRIVHKIVILRVFTVEHILQVIRLNGIFEPL